MVELYRMQPALLYRHHLLLEEVMQLDTLINDANKLQVQKGKQSNLW